MSTQTTRSGGGSGRTKKAAASGGADNTNNVTNHTNNKKQSDSSNQKQSHISDNHNNKEPVVKPHLKPTPEQTRMAQLIGNGLSSTDDGKMQEKVASLMETTQRSEEDVCLALYECDNDLDRAVIYLLEQLPEGAFESAGKKKKKNLPGANNGTAAADDDWNENAMSVPRRDDRSRNRGGGSGGGIRSSGGAGGRPQDGGRGYRGKDGGDNKFGSGGGGGGRDGGGYRSDNRGGGGMDRRGDGPGGRGRGGGFGARGGRGGRMGPRGMGSRDAQGQGDRGGRGYGRDGGFDNGGGAVEAMDNWDNSQANLPPAQSEIKTDDSWGDWDNEEYTGSLADTKVFTPSTVGSGGEGAGGADGTESAVGTSTATTIAPNYSQVCSGAVGAGGAGGAAQQSGGGASQQSSAAGTGSTQYSDLHHQSLRQGLADIPSAAATTTLSAEQSQYFKSLSSQNSSQQAAQANAYQSAGVPYPTSYASATFADAVSAAQVAGGQRKALARAKVPPPSKIPSSAVEMPGDNIGYLDVQFGLDFGSEDTFDQLSDRFAAATIDTPGNAGAGQTVVDPDQYQQQQQQVKAGQVAGQAGSVPAGLTDNLGAYVTGAVTRGAQGSVQANTGGTVAGYQSAVSQYGGQTGAGGNTGAAQVAGAANKARAPYSNQGAPGVANNSYVSNAGGYGSGQQSSTGVHQGSGAQGSNVYAQTPQQQQYGGYSQSGAYNQSNVAVNNNQAASQVQTVVNNVAAAAAAAAQTGQTVNSRYGGVTTATGSSVSGGGGGVSVGGGGSSVSNQAVNGVGPGSNSTSVASSVAAQFGNSFAGSTASKLAAVAAAAAAQNSTPSSSTAFDSVTSNVVASNAGGQGAVSAISNNAAVTATNANMNSPSSMGLVNNSKVSNPTTKSSVVPNIPIVSQYIQGVPFYQPPMYSYDELQMIQQRLPHMQTGYYDVNYQTPTSLGAAGVREGNIGAYSTMSDGRFTRTDNNSSPVSNVPSTMSQQTGSGGAMLNFPYAYFYSGNMMPGGFPYSAPVYPQQMATANATSGQFPKPNAYNSAYGSSAYDSLNQSAQDYGKSGYQSTGVGQQQSKGQSVNNSQQSGSGTDISSSMYGKSHVALNKVNSYDKQSFHSATPPPYNLAGTQTTGQTSQPYGMYVSAMPAPHHNMNMHQPMHQDSNSSGGQRQQSNSQSKAGTKQGYSPSYWATQN